MIVITVGSYQESIAWSHLMYKGFNSEMFVWLLTNVILKMKDKTDSSY